MSNDHADFPGTAAPTEKEVGGTGVPESKPNVPFFRRGGKANRNIRKRRKSPDDSSDDDGTTVARKERKPNKSVLASTTKESKAAEPDVLVTYSSNKTVAGITSRDNATRGAEWDTEFDRDAQALLEKKLAAEEAVDDNLYKGQHAYKTYIKKRDTAAGSAAGSKIKAGPIRAPVNIRVTSRFDYQPDVCKDYKETGYCGYGDSCKFLHDRGDYKTGWQLDKEWEEMHGRLQRDPNAFLIESSENDSEEELPFSCLICREEFTNPVETKCGHYFCERCALQNFAKSPKCFACGAATNGIFNAAKRLAKKLEEKKKRMTATAEGETEGLSAEKDVEAVGGSDKDADSEDDSD